MRILGVDPGLQHTGWGIIESDGYALKFVAAGVINTTPKDGISDRLLEIHVKLLEVIKHFQPNSSAIEETYVNKNYGSSLKLSHARAAAILTLALSDIKPAEYSAKTIKKTIVGSGQAEKEQVSNMLKFLMPGINVGSKDAADAIAIAVCHSRFYGAPNRLNTANF